ncbi:MAG TPA: hypothetical protein ENK52_06120, partial [Saprospiraceae bacterium]|nr:hypothetical protein [Saprospiraceae bacterium]
MFKFLQKTFWDLNFRWSKTTLKKILKVLDVDNSNMPKSRYGRKGDGGYVIFSNHFDEEENYNLLSFGIDNEISFEKEIFEKHPNIHIYCFDPTVNSPFPKNNLISP